MGVLYVALGGALGAVLRYGTVSILSKFMEAVFPYGTISVNIIGSYIIGWLMAASIAETKDVHLFLVVGVLGGFTTFSAFSYDALTLFQRGDITQAILYIIASVILSLCAVLLGYYGLRING